MQAKVVVYRFHPDDGLAPHYDSFTLDIDSTTTVLDCLTQIKDEHDRSLTFRSSCRIGACGDCTTRINGVASLTCKVLASKEIEKHGLVCVEPLAGFQVIRDLVVDLKPFWQTMEEMLRRLDLGDCGGSLSFHLTERVQQAAFCILCGACQSECPVHQVDTAFVGPAALTKVYRFAIDSRHSHSKSHAVEIASGRSGVFDCARCYSCDEACPKGVRPAGNIAALRRMVMQNGAGGDAGRRHTKAIMDDVCKSGRPNEASLAIKTWGYNPFEMLRAMPLALRLLLRGKLAWRVRPVRNAEEIRKIVAKVQEMQIREETVQ